MKVLLADDEVTVFVTLRDALEEAGHDVLGATDTRSALEALEDRGGESRKSLSRISACQGEVGSMCCVRPLSSTPTGP